IACLCASLFVFQAEDGIRDRNVTGVQTCALPISRPCALRGARLLGQRRAARPSAMKRRETPCALHWIPAAWTRQNTAKNCKAPRSEERRVGNESRTRRSAYQK